MKNGLFASLWLLFSTSALSKAADIAPQQIPELLKDSPVSVNVRTAEIFREGHFSDWQAAGLSLEFD